MSKDQLEEGAHLRTLRLLLILVFTFGVLLRQCNKDPPYAYQIKLSTNVVKGLRTGEGVQTKLLQNISPLGGRITKSSTVEVVANCSSMYHQAGVNEHSPLVFGFLEKEIVVCRTPKVGSTLLRIMANAFRTNTPFDDKLRDDRVDPEMQLGDKGMQPGRFEHLISAKSNVSRIMFVRHPILRLLSAYADDAALGAFEMQKTYNVSHDSAEGFAIFAKDLLHKDYVPDCGSEEHAMKMSRSPWEQHWAPPQHCRCGISDCNVVYEFFPLERIQSIQAILKLYFGVDEADKQPPAWLPHAAEKAHKKDEGSMRRKAKTYLTEDVLEHLNNLTKEEQEFFGYLPLTIEQVANGTVGMVDDPDGWVPLK